MPPRSYWAAFLIGNKVEISAVPIQSGSPWSLLPFGFGRAVRVLRSMALQPFTVMLLGGEVPAPEPLSWLRLQIHERDAP